MKRILVFVFAILLGIGLSVPAKAARIKDLARWEGVEENPIVGIGVVVGL